MSTKTLDLRDLSEADRDAEVNEAVSLIAGESPDSWLCYHCGFEAYRHRMGDQEHSFTPEFTPYATSADAVIPILEKYCWTKTELGEVIIWNGRTIAGASGREKYPLSLAACFAILCANGYEVLT